MSEFNRVDIAEAYAAYGSLYHSGQWSIAYSDMCRAMKLLNGRCPGPANLSENGLEIYVALGGSVDDVQAAQFVGESPRYIDDRDPADADRAIELGHFRCNCPEF